MERTGGAQCHLQHLQQRSSCKHGVGVKGQGGADMSVQGTAGRHNKAVKSRFAVPRAAWALAAHLQCWLLQRQTVASSVRHARHTAAAVL